MLSFNYQLKLLARDHHFIRYAGFNGMNHPVRTDVATPRRRDDANIDGPARGRKKVVWFSLLIIAFSFVAYSNSLTNGYAYDDPAIIVKNPTIRSISNVVSSLHSYRPVRWFTFALDYRLWKLDPFGYHLTNVFLHSVCGLLVFGVARLLIKDLVGAFIVSLLFCTHPVTTEAVGNISNRNELLGTMFSLSAFYFYTRKNETWLFMLAVFPLHILALMSKEAIAVSLPLCFIAYDFYFNRTADGKMPVSRILPGFAFLTITVVAVGLAVVKGLPIGRHIREVFLFLSENTFLDASPVLISINIWIRAMAKGLLLTIYPKGLSADYPIPHVPSLVDASFIGSLVVLVVFVLAIVFVAKRSRVASFGLLWMFIFLLPVTNIVPVTKHFMADRYLYAPSIGFCLALGLLITAVYRYRVKLVEYKAQKRSVLVLLAVLLTIFTVADLRRNRDWQSDYTIWPKTASQHPDSPLARVNVGVVLQVEGKYTDAIKEYEKAIAIYEGYNLSFSGSDREKREPSMITTELYASAYNNIGGSYMKLRMYEEAIPKLKTAIAVNPFLYGAYCNLGVSYTNLGQLDEAIEWLKRAVEIHSRYPDAHQALSYAYEKKGMVAEAKRESDIARMLSEKNIPK